MRSTWDDHIEHRARPVTPPGNTMSISMTRSMPGARSRARAAVTSGSESARCRSMWIG